MILATTALLGCSADDLGSQIDEIRDGEKASIFTAAALIDVHVDGISGDCSGALIAPKVVLTAGHCVHEFTSWTVTLPYAGERRESKEAETFDWNVPRDQPSPQQHDIGLVYLDEPITIDVYPTLVDKALKKGTKVRYIGRVDDGVVSSTDLFVGAELPVRPGADYGWPHTFATTKYAEAGDSGGPVVLAKGSDMVIAGVDSGGNDELNVALFARSDEVHAWIRERIAAR